jgi:hypothetical protein
MYRCISLLAGLAGLAELGAFSEAFSAFAAEAFLGAADALLAGSPSWLKLDPRGRAGISMVDLETSFVENILVNLSFMDGFSAGLVGAS